METFVEDQPKTKAFNNQAVTKHSPFGPRGERLSIIIPTYNCANYLEETLLSVRRETENVLEEAQILVIDDYSTKDDPKAVIDRIWPGRVEFFRQPQNVGPCANFNACLERAERDWIHMLHGDDFILPGAYQEFAATVEAVPDAIAVFGRSIIVDEDSFWLGCSLRLGKDARGRFEYKPQMWSISPTPCPGVLISRRAIETVGTFDPSFCHAQDCNMWWRIVRTGRAAYTNTCVGAYRESTTNHTSSLLSSGKNLAEDLDQTERVADSVRSDPSHNAATLEELYEDAYWKVLRQCNAYLGNTERFRASFRMFDRFPATFRKRRSFWLVQLRHYKHLLAKALGLREPKLRADLN